MDLAALLANIIVMIRTILCSHIGLKSCKTPLGQSLLVPDKAGDAHFMSRMMEKQKEKKIITSVPASLAD